MPARHQLRLHSTTGTLLAVFDSWRQVTVNRKLNSFSEHVFKIDKKKDNRWQLFDEDVFVELLRSNTQYGIPWTREYIGFHITPQHTLTEAGTEIFTSYGRSVDDLLTRRSVLYFPGSGYPEEPAISTRAQQIHSYTYKKGPADDMMKEYVYENLCAGANNIYRLRNGVWPNVSVATDSSLAPEYEGENGLKTVMEALQDISNSKEVDFSVELTSLSPPTFLFTTYYPFRGTDRSVGPNAVIFSPTRQNVKTLDYTYSRTEEANIAIVIGEVTGYHPVGDPLFPNQIVTNRSYYVASSLRATDSPWRDIEVVKDAKLDQSDTALQSSADEAMRLLQGKESITVSVLPSNNTQYGRDFFFGDKITVSYLGRNFTKRVVGVTIDSGGEESDQGERIGLELADQLPKENLFDVMRTITARVAYTELSK